MPENLSLLRATSSLRGLLGDALIFALTTTPLIARQPPARYNPCVNMQAAKLGCHRASPRATAESSAGALRLVGSWRSLRPQIGPVKIGSSRNTTGRCYSRPQHTEPFLAAAEAPGRMLQSFGLLWEDQRDRPVRFSRSKVPLSQVDPAQRQATGTWRLGEAALPVRLFGPLFTPSVSSFAHSCPREKSAEAAHASSPVPTTRNSTP